MASNGITDVTTLVAQHIGQSAAIAVYGALCTVAVDVQFTKEYGTLAAEWLMLAQDLEEGTQ